MSSKSKNIGECIQNFPKQTQGKLRQMYKLIHKITPKAEEGLKWGMPAFPIKESLESNKKWKGK